MNKNIKNNFYALGKTYLESNACGLWDGSLKASTHKSLCELFVSERLNISIADAVTIEVDGNRISDLVRESTLLLTDNLDEEIGLPLETAPNYKKLTPMFVDKFLQLANDWFDDQTGIISDEVLKTVLERVTRQKFSYTMPALESYGFSFVEGQGEDTKPIFLTMKSKLGQFVTVKPNQYFGCSFTLDKGLNS